MKQVLIWMALMGLIVQVKAQERPPELRELIEKSVVNSKQVHKNQLLAEKARCDRQNALLSYLPQINAEAGYTHLNEDVMLPEDMLTLLTATQSVLFKQAYGMTLNAPLPPQYQPQEIPPIQSKDITKASINGQMVLFSGLKIPYLAKAASRQAQMYELLGENEKNVSTKHLLEAYDQLVVLVKSEDVLKATSDNLDQQARYVKKAVETGLATSLEMSRIELARQQLLQKRIELATGRQLVLARIHQLTGVSFDVLMGINPEWSMVLNDQKQANVESRPDMLALEKAVEATDFKRKAEFTEYVPKLVAYGKKEFITDDLSAFDPEWYVGVGLKWKIFDGGKATRDAKKSKIDMDIYRASRSEAMDLLQLKFKQEQIALENSRQQLEVAKQKLRTTTQAYDMSWKQYQNGLITLREHLESENDLERAKLEIINAQYQIRVSIYGMYETRGDLYEQCMNVL
ncbi:MAG: TolC family protein [Bacteroidales bacterium]|nr:TolC family protein [Bacteroidales bacterium]